MYCHWRNWATLSADIRTVTCFGASREFTFASSRCDLLSLLHVKCSSLVEFSDDIAGVEREWFGRPTYILCGLHNPQHTLIGLLIRSFSFSWQIFHWSKQSICEASWWYHIFHGGISPKFIRIWSLCGHFSDFLRTPISNFTFLFR